MLLTNKRFTMWKLNETILPHIVIVGAGAGGLELATRLGNLFHQSHQAKVTLVNDGMTHLWKPLWHEVAAGTLDSHEDELNLVTHAFTHHFYFQLGQLESIERSKKQIWLVPLIDKNQQEILPRRSLTYDLLVIAVGSITNDFNIPGVAQHCLFLDTRAQAEYFQQQFLKTFIASQIQQPSQINPLTIAIVGGGATGVELAAELHYAAYQAIKYRWIHITDQSVIKLTIIESGPSILANLTKGVIESTTAELTKRGIEVLVNEKVTHVDAQGFHTQSGRYVLAQLKVWAAGIKAPEFLKHLDGLETNRINQLMVKMTLQTTVDDNIFAFGDCAYCPQPGTDKAVPPRAQAAYQQAALLAKSLTLRLANKPLLEYRYHDYGSVISLGINQSVGNLMGRAGGNLFISGFLARWAYRYLYRKHQAVLHNWWRVALLIIASWLTRQVKPRLKLH
jgi:NADH dehydrogenase